VRSSVPATFSRTARKPAQVELQQPQRVGEARFTEAQRILVQRINEMSCDSLPNAIERGRLLKQLNLHWSQYDVVVKVSFQTAYKLMQLVDHPRMTRTDWERPSNWSVCHEVVILPENIFQSMLDRRLLNAHTTRRQVRDFLRAYRLKDRPPSLHKLTHVEINRIYHGDCMSGLKAIDAGSVDMILSDLPYGVTDNQWDQRLPLYELWAEYKRILKPCGVVVLTADFGFACELRAAAPDWFRCEWIWEKSKGTNPICVR